MELPSKETVALIGKKWIHPLLGKKSQAELNMAHQNILKHGQGQ